MLMAWTGVQRRRAGLPVGDDVRVSVEACRMAEAKSMLMIVQEEWYDCTSV